MCAMIEVKALLQAPVRRAREVDPDAALVVAAREEPRRFLALYDRYFDRVLGYVRLRIRDDATCEDVTSTVFTTALAQLGRFRGDGSFAGWLFQIARNAVRDVHRRPIARAAPARGRWFRAGRRGAVPGPRARGPTAGGDRSAQSRPAASARAALRSGSRVRRDRRRSSAPLRERFGSACTGFLKSYDGGIPMTTEELERDLMMLAEPRESDEPLRRATRARLGEQMLVRPRRRPRPRIGLGGAAVAAAAIAVAILTLGGPGGSAGPSAADAAIIRHALQAITSPANVIVHVKETGSERDAAQPNGGSRRVRPMHSG